MFALQTSVHRNVLERVDIGQHIADVAVKFADALEATKVLCADDLLAVLTDQGIQLVVLALPMHRVGDALTGAADACMNPPNRRSSSQSISDKDAGRAVSPRFPRSRRPVCASFSAAMR